MKQDGIICDTVDFFKLSLIYPI